MSTSFRQPFSPTPLQVLSIAGSDPSGGAGIQGDLKTFASLGAYGMSVITALTAQNTCGVRSIHIPPVDFFHSQLQSIWDDIEIDAIKIGMLANNEIILSLKEQLNERANSKKIGESLTPSNIGNHSSPSPSLSLIDSPLVFLVVLLQSQSYSIQSWSRLRALCC